MFPSLLIPLPRMSKKNDEPNNVEKAHKSPESPTANEKLESFAQQIPGNFQNITRNMPTINTSLLYWKDNLDGHSSNDILTIDVFMKKSFF